MAQVTKVYYVCDVCEQEIKCNGISLLGNVYVMDHESENIGGLLGNSNNACLMGSGVLPPKTHYHVHCFISTINKVEAHPGK